MPDQRRPENLQDLEKLVYEWETQQYDPETRKPYGAVLEEIRFHGDHRYWQFTPALADRPTFEERLADWISNCWPNAVHQKILLQLIPHLQFVDRDDLIALYRAAFNGPIYRWIMNQVNINLLEEPAAIHQRVDEAVHQTWFCPITDSMDIAQFHHANEISGKSYRPAWRDLSEFGDVEKIRKYVAKNNVHRLVLLEDFVGSGTQVRAPIRFAIDALSPQVPIMVCPLVISEAGIEPIQAFAGNAAFTFEPVFTVPAQVHVHESPTAGEEPLLTEVRQVVINTFPRVRTPMPWESGDLAYAFGFGSLGMLLVLYTNCPNNTLPLIWHESPQWKPLFPRVSRS